MPTHHFPLPPQRGNRTRLSSLGRYLIMGLFASATGLCQKLPNACLHCHTRECPPMPPCVQAKSKSVGLRRQREQAYPSRVRLRALTCCESRPCRAQTPALHRQATCTCCIGAAGGTRTERIRDSQVLACQFGCAGGCESTIADTGLITP